MKSLITCVAVAALALATPAVSQDLFGQLKSLTTPSAGGGTAASFFASFLAARIEMNQAQIEFAQAFELKDQMTLLQAEQTRLQSGTIDAKGIKASKDLSDSANAAIQEKMAQNTELDAKGRAHYQAAMPHLVAGTIATVRLTNEAKGAIQSSTLMEKASLMLAAKDMPSFVKTTADNYKLFFTYGKENKIPMPANATDALGGL